MTLLKWDSNYDVNGSVIDTHHKQIILLLNNLHEAIVQHTTEEELESVLHGLVHYVEHNFKVEEELLRMGDYPYYQEHLLSHQKLTEKVRDLQFRYDEGEDLTYDMMQFLTDWVMKHILAEDKMYESYMNEISERAVA